MIRHKCTGIYDPRNGYVPLIYSYTNKAVSLWGLGSVSEDVGVTQRTEARSDSGRVASNLQDC